MSTKAGDTGAYIQDFHGGSFYKVEHGQKMSRGFENPDWSLRERMTLLEGQETPAQIPESSQRRHLRSKAFSCWSDLEEGRPKKITSLPVKISKLVSSMHTRIILSKKPRQTHDESRWWTPASHLSASGNESKDHKQMSPHVPNQPALRTYLTPSASGELISRYK